MTTNIPEEDKSIILEKALNLLIEHFDTVQILCTNHKPDENATDCYSRGRGNLFARLGYAKTWVKMTDNDFLSEEELDEE